MILNITEIRKLLLEDLSKVVTPYGFLFNKKDLCFKRKTRGFIQIFDLIFYKESRGIKIQPIIKLKSKEIEEVYHSVSKKDSKYNSGTITIGADLFKIVDYLENCTSNDINSNQFYLIENEKGYEIILKVLTDKFIKYALAYFNENSSVSRIDYLLNKNPNETSIHNDFYPLRACIGIIAASLNNNPGLQDLVECYESNLKKSPNHYRIEFKELKESLFKKNSSE